MLKLDEKAVALLETVARPGVLGARKPSGVTGSNNDSIAISPDGKRVVWAPNGTAAAYTSINWTSNKAAWTAVSGLPAQANVRADRVTASKFYGFSNRSVLRQHQRHHFHDDREFRLASFGEDRAGL